MSRAESPSLRGRSRRGKFTRRDVQAPTDAAARVSGSQTPRASSVSPGGGGEGTARGRRLRSRGSELRQVAYGLHSGKGTKHPDGVSTRLDAVTHDSRAWPRPVLAADLRFVGGLGSARRGSSEVAPQGGHTGAYPSQWRPPPGRGRGLGAPPRSCRPAEGQREQCGLLPPRPVGQAGAPAAPEGTSPARLDLWLPAAKLQVNFCV